MVNDGCVASLLGYLNLGFSQNYGSFAGVAYNEDYSIFGSILGFPFLGKLPFEFLNNKSGDHDCKGIEKCPTPAARVPFVSSAAAAQWMYLE